MPHRLVAPELSLDVDLEAAREADGPPRDGSQRDLYAARSVGLPEHSPRMTALRQNVGRCMKLSACADPLSV
jgi:hypothetical protein